MLRAACCHVLIVRDGRAPTQVARRVFLGSELGGSNTAAAWGSFALFTALWFAYIGLYKYFETAPLFK